MKTEYDFEKLNREMDKTKSRVFMTKGNAAFLAPLMCSMEFQWMPEIKTAATDGRFVGWNPDFYMSLTPETRETVLVHELWHPALLHMLRKGDRDHQIWNQACDIRINNDLKAAGYSFKGIEWCWMEPELDENGRMAEEDIYDWLVKTKKQPPKAQPDFSSGPGKDKYEDGDLQEPSKEDAQAVINSVIRAVHEHVLSGGCGKVPGIVTETLDKFLEPVVPWEAELQVFMTELLETCYSWQRPNRRYPDVYLPSVYEDEGRLEHLCYYLDVSGSCSNADVLRFNSEVKYIKDTFNPKRLTVCQFTTEIVHIDEFTENDPFETVIRHGTGGTSFVPVRKHMLEHRPTAAIVFSDMDCPPMEPLGIDIPTIWVAIRAANRSVPFGRIIRIRK